MTTLATDDFNRANAGTLGANYSTNGVYSQLTIVSNKANVFSLAASLRTAEVYPNDQWAQATISGITGSMMWGGVVVRGKTAAESFYAAGANSGDFGNARQRIWKMVAATRTSLAASGSTD